MNYNKVILIGRLTRDPELKTIQSGSEYVNFTLAVSRSYTNEAGERQADFINCIAWRSQAKFLANYMKKGSLILVNGEIRTRTYDSDGKTNYITEVLVDQVQSLEPKPQDGAVRPSNQRSNQEPQPVDPFADVKENPFFETSGPIVEDDDDLPF